MFDKSQMSESFDVPAGCDEPFPPKKAKCANHEIGRDLCKGWNPVTTFRKHLFGVSLQDF